MLEEDMTRLEADNTMLKENMTRLDAVNSPNECLKPPN
jgi:hypothetical protein